MNNITRRTMELKKRECRCALWLEFIALVPDDLTIFAFVGQFVCEEERRADQREEKRAILLLRMPS